MSGEVMVDCGRGPPAMALSGIEGVLWSNRGVLELLILASNHITSSVFIETLVFQ